jgi:hypothetical protein
MPLVDYEIIIDSIKTGNKCQQLDPKDETIFCECNRYDLSRFPTIYFDMGGHLFPFLPKFYLLFDRRRQACAITIHKEPRANKINFFILGDPFLRAFFQVYNIDD